ncbi:MAG: hypothetical protein WCD18_16680 [Thermosynechococcaceae cyanobacterium]
MQKSLTRPQKSEPIYTRLWNGFKQFPASLHKGSVNAPSSSGPAAAALISGGVGAVCMMATHHFAELSKANNQIVIAMGSWIPGAMNPDPMWGNLENYAGKEMMFFIGWWVSWPVLYLLLRNRQLKPRSIFMSLFGLFALATAMAWHPLFPYLTLK